MKIRICSLVFALLLLLSSCRSAEDIPDGVTTEAPESSAFPIVLTDAGTAIAVEYCEGIYDEGRPSYGGALSLEAFGLRRIGNITQSESVERTEVLIAGTSYTYVDSEQYYSDHDKTVPGTFYSIYDRYTADGASLEMHRAGRVALWYENVNEGNSILISKEDYLQIALPFLKNTFDIEIPEGYDSDEPKASFGRRVLTFRRTLHGYQTDDFVEVGMSMTKKIVRVDARRFGSFDHVAEKLTKDRLDRAHTMLLERIANAGLPEDHTVSEPMLTTNNEGRVFLQVAVSYKLDGRSFGELLYINVT